MLVFALIGFWECQLLGDVDDDEIEMLANLGNILGVRYRYFDLLFVLAIDFKRLNDGVSR